MATLQVGPHSAFRVSSGSGPPGAKIGGLIAGILGPIAMTGRVLLLVSEIDPTQPARPAHKTDQTHRPRKTAPQHSWRPKLGILTLPHDGWGVGLSTPF